jgi:hypothetical protein
MFHIIFTLREGKRINLSKQFIVLIRKKVGLLKEINIKYIDCLFK